MQTYAKLLPISNNSKTGPIAVSYTDKNSCPSICAFKSNGCYAENGNVNIHWQRVGKLDESEKKRGKPWVEFCQDVEDLPKNRLFRHNAAGDLPHTDGTINRAALTLLVKSARRVRGFTYTHHDTSIKSNQLAIKQANKKGFVVNLSANNYKHADELKALNIAPVVVVQSMDAPKISYTENGHKVVTCPATYKEEVTCHSCELCANPTRNGVIVGFPAHGPSKKRAESATINFVSKVQILAQGTIVK